MAETQSSEAMNNLFLIFTVLFTVVFAHKFEGFASNFGLAEPVTWYFVIPSLLTLYAFLHLFYRTRMLRRVIALPYCGLFLGFLITVIGGLALPYLYHALIKWFVNPNV